MFKKLNFRTFGSRTREAKNQQFVVLLERSCSVRGVGEIRTKVNGLNGSIISILKFLMRLETQAKAVFRVQFHLCGPFKALPAGIREWLPTVRTLGPSTPRTRSGRLRPVHPNACPGSASLRSQAGPAQTTAAAQSTAARLRVTAGGSFRSSSGSGASARIGHLRLRAPPTGDNRLLTLRVPLGFPGHVLSPRRSWRAWQPRP
ncbi:uncharacterized protein [Notamacropus eugenii]|uniref:uncharacterized protein n=1 Tax=Notamacropus eugenii TaxID=9315 RepID=UPI003B67F337